MNKPDYINIELFSKWYNNGSNSYLFIKNPLAVYNTSNRTFNNIYIPENQIKFIGYFKIEFIGIQYDNYVFNPIDIKKDFQYIRSQIIRYKEITTTKVYHCILAKSIDDNNIEIFDPMGGNWIKYFPNSIGKYHIHKIFSDIYPQKIESTAALCSCDLLGYCQTWCFIYIYNTYFDCTISILEWVSKYSNKTPEELRNCVLNFNLIIRRQIDQSEKIEIPVKNHKYNNRQQALINLIKLL